MFYAILGGLKFIRTCLGRSLALLGLLGGSLSGRAFTPAAGTGYRIEVKNSGLMLWENIYNGSQHVPLVLQTFRGGGDATWTFTPMTGGYYHILNPLRNLLLACDAGDTNCYLEAVSAGNGTLWSLTDEGGGYVGLVNKLNGRALTVRDFPENSYTPLVTVTNAHQDRQQFWLGEFRTNPVPVIAVPAGWDTQAPKRLVLCATNNQGASVAGHFIRQRRIGAHYPGVQRESVGAILLHEHGHDLCAHGGVYTVTAPGFTNASFAVADNYYRATPDGRGGLCGVSNVLSGFFCGTTGERGGHRADGVVTLPGGSNVVQGIAGDLHGGWKDATSIDIETIQESPRSEICPMRPRTR